MEHNLIDSLIIDNALAACGIRDMEDATIRDIVRTVNIVETTCNERFIRMEMGVPGLPPSPVGIEAEIEALRQGVAQFYPMLEGDTRLKEEGARFVKNFMNIDIRPEGIIPTVGSMQACFATFLATTSCREERDTLLFIDPGFPVQKNQMQVIGKPYVSFDVYNYRGERLRAKLEEYLDTGRIAAILYSNPNNPAWVCLTEEELQMIGELATKHDVIILEDLAYFAMDCRKELSRPGVPPFQPTVGRYTSNYIVLISGSKLFNYAGQRLGLMCISDALYHRRYNHLQTRFGGDGTLGYTLVNRIIYTLSSGTTHSSQHAMRAILQAANEERLNILDGAREYARRAHIMKEIFLKHDFYLAYDADLDEPIADGFYFTLAYPGMSGGTLTRELLYYGISAIPLRGTGSTRPGARACVSQVGMDRMETLDERLTRFQADHPLETREYCK
ncbi:MAG: pyridoxal phosphate-dependent aminotransferase [Odoribacteraceae bacterium]|jgi:aspartate/methionine/tyrosine aminotransferase|nr:pyridoxal phosphate-dependent aminotransferase [Odoribacteraceae bacterium]